MARRSIASLTLSFGLVSIPVKVYVATESSAAIRFKLMGRSGFHVRQLYVPEPETGPAETDEEPLHEGVSAAPALRSGGSRQLSLVRDEAPADDEADDSLPERPALPPPYLERSSLVKGYEFAKGQYVLFSDEELAALRSESRQSIDIVAFLPAGAVDPVYYDKAYYLSPDKRGHKAYSLLLEALRTSGRTALARWAWRAKEYVVEIRPTARSLVLQQLLYADEVRSAEQLDIELTAVSGAELKLALQVIEQNAVASYDPSQYVDEEKQRILAAVERKIAGNRVVAPPRRAASAPSADVIDLIAALRGSLKAPEPARKRSSTAAAALQKERKPARRAGAPDGATPTAVRKRR